MNLLFLCAVGEERRDVPVSSFIIYFRSGTSLKEHHLLSATWPDSRGPLHTHARTHT